MVICVMARRIWTHGVGGMESHTRLVVAELARRGHVVHVVTTSMGDRPGDEAPSGVRLHYLSGTPPGDYSAAWWRESRAWGERHFARLGVEAVLSVSRAGRAVARMRRRPRLFAVCHGYGWSQLQGFWHDRGGRAKFLRFPADVAWVVADIHAWRPLLDAADAVFAGSRDLCSRLPSARAVYLPNVVDVTQFSPDATVRAATRSSLGVRGDDLVALMVGTINRQKGVLEGLQACAEVAGTRPRLRAVVVGDGPALEAIRAWARTAAHLRVTFIGQKDHRELPPYYAAADLFLLPSRRHEVLPLTLLEAMAAGLPAIATRAGGTAEAIRHGETGYLVGIGDTAAFAAAISELTSDDDSRRRNLGTAARRLAEEGFDVRRVVERLLGYLQAARS